jgi:hypothetical protein
MPLRPDQPVTLHPPHPAQTDTSLADVATDASSATDGTTTEQPASLTEATSSQSDVDC